MARLDIQQKSGKLIIRYARRSSVGYFLLAFGTIWSLGALLPAILSGEYFLLAFASIGLLMFYYGLMLTLNTLTLTVDRRSLVKTQAPLPWVLFRAQDIPSSAIQQLYVDRGNVEVNNQPTYDLKVILDTGEEVKLLGEQQELQLVQHLEKTIEAFLDITNDAALDLRREGRSSGEIQKMYEAVKRLRAGAEERIWMPDFVKSALSDQEAALRKALHVPGETQPASPAPPTSPRTGVPASAAPADAAPSPTALATDGDLSLPSAPGRPRPLPAPDHQLVFPLYRQAEGTRLTYNGTPYRIGRTVQTDWQDDDATTARQIELLPAAGDPVHLYAQPERSRWAYYEERRLDDAEIDMLGFTRATPPHRLANGDERYYPRDRQEGTRFAGRGGRPISQYFYFTTSSSTQFRALLPKDGQWEVYVLEPVDGGNFEAL